MFFFNKFISVLRLIIHVSTEQPSCKCKGTTCIINGPGSSVGLATDYSLDIPGSNPVGDENFRPSRPALGSTQPPVKSVTCLSEG